MPEQIFTFTDEEILEMLKSGRIRLLKAPLEPAPEKKLAMQEAKSIFGEDFFGPKEVEKAFGLNLHSKDIPPVKFSPVELERAKKLGHMLILRVDKAPEGEPLTMEKINDLLQEKFWDEEKGVVLYSYNGLYLSNQPFFTEQTPRVGWALVSKECVPGTGGVDYLDQTQELAQYLENEIFDTLPDEYVSAVEEFQSQREDIEHLMDLNSDIYDIEEAVRKLGQLKLNRMLRHTMVEALYDNLLIFQNTGERLMEDVDTWTCDYLEGCLLTLGRFDREGASITEEDPEATDPCLQVYLSRYS